MFSLILWTDFRWTIRSGAKFNLIAVLAYLSTILCLNTLIWSLDNIICFDKILNLGIERVWLTKSIRKLLIFNFLFLIVINYHWTIHQHILYLVLNQRIKILLAVLPFRNGKIVGLKVLQKLFRPLLKIWVLAFCHGIYQQCE
jgi:hypothetical protein